MRYSNLFHWANYAQNEAIASEFYSKFAGNLAALPLACDLSLSLCRKKDGDGLVHLFIDAPRNDPAAATGKKVWEIVHEFLKNSGCPGPQGWDELTTSRLADVGPQLAGLGVRVVFTTKREKGTVTTGAKKRWQFWK